MSNLNDLAPKPLTIKVFGQEKEVLFTVRTYAALQRVFNMSQEQLMEGIFGGSIECIVKAVWASTLVFDSFDSQNPVKIKEQLDIEKLYNLGLDEVCAITGTLVQALLDSLPQPEEDQEATEGQEAKKPGKTQEAKKVSKKKSTGRS